MKHLDDEAVSPILVWDASCRDRLSALTWAHWEDWRRRGKVGASLRWVPAYLPEEVLLPEAHSSEPCVAGLYFRLYAAEPGFALEKDMVEGFLVCSVEVRKEGAPGPTGATGSVRSTFTQMFIVWVLFEEGRKSQEVGSYV